MSGADLFYILSVPVLVGIAAAMVMAGISVQDRVFARHSAKHKRR